MSSIYNSLRHHIPLVSCIMPTSAARKEFIPLALSYFGMQDYEAAELIVLDDGNTPVKDLMPDAANIHYINPGIPFKSLGEKRNYACAAANGDIILHWDDDDWYAYDWISRQVKHLIDSGGGISGLNNLNFYAPSAQLAWKYRYNYGKPWVAGATLVYYKKVWKRNPFPHINVGEDNQFVWNAQLKVAPLEYEDGFVSILHSKNTSPKHTNDPQWQPVSTEHIRSILKDAIHNYPCHHEPQ